MRAGWAAVALAAALLPAGCETWRYPGAVDGAWVRSFSERLPVTVASADAVVVGKMVCSLGDRGKVVSLFRVSEVLKGQETISRAMAPHPEIAGSVTVAYDRPRDAVGHQEPSGNALLFMTEPREPGKNMHLLGDAVDEGMIYALPSLTRKVRKLCLGGGL